MQIPPWDWFYIFCGIVAALYTLGIVLGIRRGEAEREINDQGL